MADCKPLTKTEVTSTLAERTGLSKQQVNEFFDELVKLVGENLAETGPGVLNISGLMKFKVTRKEAQPEREGKHPFTGEMTTFAAKPARNVVKVTPLKRLKDAV
ncbi:HU family DNA-binding protein [Planctomycetota bacterium]